MDVEIKSLKPGDLRFDGKNPNEMSKAEFGALKDSISRFGFAVPVITNKDLLVADGEHRAKAALELGLDNIPVAVLAIDEVDRRILRQVMNKLRGEHDKDKDLEEIRFLMESNAEAELLALLPNVSNEIKGLIDKINSKGEDDYEVPEIDKIQTDIKRGDLFQLGDHRLLCGDATNKEDVDKLMNGEKIDLLLTDPPYGIGIVKANGKIGFGDGRLGFHNKDKATGTIRGTIGGWGIVPVGIHKIIEGDDKPFNPEHLLKLGDNQIIWGGNYFADKIPSSSCWIIWDKRENIPSNNFADCEIAWTNFKKPSRIFRHKWSGLIRAGNRDEELSKRVHPTQKPVGLFKELLVNYSEENHIVMDCYGGSGSTLIACEQLKRKCRMIEIDPQYVEVICQRWEKLTGKQRVKIDG